MRFPRLFGCAARVGCLTVLIVGVILYVMVKTTEKPQFCSTCHIMKPYYRAWETSSHNKVPCIECHYAPGILSTMEGKFKALSQVAKYVTRTEGTRPWAEIPDTSCLRSGCHERRLLEGKVKFGEITFDHRPHLLQQRRGKQLRCTSCHSQIVMGSHIAVTNSTCFICHFKNMPPGKAVGGCTSCHEAPKKTINVKGLEFNHTPYVMRGVQCAECHLDVTEGDGSVAREKCIACHAEPERLAKYGDHELVHRKHVTEHKVECFQCHDEIRHGAIRLKESITPSCESCHKDTHTAQRDMYFGVGGRHVKSAPSIMQIAKVECRGCHIVDPNKPDAHLKGTSLKAYDMSCMACHGVEFEKVMQGWQKFLSQNMVDVERLAAQVEKRRAGWAVV
ncbi:MAG: cytochrome c3 family protein, partial [bacterium]